MTEHCVRLRPAPAGGGRKAAIARPARGNLARGVLAQARAQVQQLRLVRAAHQAARARHQLLALGAPHARLKVARLLVVACKATTFMRNRLHLRA